MIHISSSIVNDITRHAERDYPYECCGLLLGEFQGAQKRVTAAYPISNAREEEAKRNRFLIQPEELLRGEQYAALKRLEIVGFYHSHPEHPAVPSTYDLQHAWPVFSYLVVAVSGGEAGDLRSWELEPDRSRFNEEEVHLENSGEAAALSAAK